MAGARTGSCCTTSRTMCLIIAWLEVIVLISLLIGGLVAISVGFVGMPNECPQTNPNDMESIVNSAVFSWKHDGDKCWRPEYRQQFIIMGILILAVCGLYLFAPGCLIHGVSNGKSTFLVPFIVCSVLNNIFSLVLLLGGWSTDPGAGIITTIYFVVGIYKTVVVCCHYNYLTENPKVNDETLVNKGAYVNF